MSEWVELKYLKDDKINKCAVRCYAVTGVEATGTDSCKVYMDDYTHHWTVTEPYEDVMGKIHEAEGPVTIPVAEHFTMEEYKFLLNTLETISISADGPGAKVGRKIIKTIREILEEDKCEEK